MDGTDSKGQGLGVGSGLQAGPGWLAVHREHVWEGVLASCWSRRATRFFVDLLPCLALPEPALVPDQIARLYAPLSFGQAVPLGRGFLTHLVFSSLGGPSPPASTSTPTHGAVWPGCSLAPGVPRCSLQHPPPPPPPRHRPPVSYQPGVVLPPGLVICICLCAPHGD
ncbi:hypothetical protein HJG60_008059 [Phyllostomus discolor]|uniref:Uncharacterized protein n=1 Tax=Phyllostomus discolor TaxID=89673 RepID=A0A834BLK8_9CHIR|nr:hypothetical protein HJG60_008059 [Phyllostomus discolor]